MPFTAAYILSALRIATGLALVVFPRANLQLAKIAQPSAASGIVATRFMGARELAMGGLLLHALYEQSLQAGEHTEETPLLIRKAGEHQPKSLSMLKSVLVAGVVADAVDIGSCAVCFLEGRLTIPSALGVGGLGIVAVVWGLYCYRVACQKVEIRQ
jgi:hypothetical protein